MTDDKSQAGSGIRQLRILVLSAAVVVVLLYLFRPQQQPTPPSGSPEAPRPEESATSNAEPTPPDAPQTAGPTLPSKPHAREVQATSLLGRPLYALTDAPDLPDLEAQLQQARRELDADPDNPEKMVWVGRRLGYLWRMKEAIDLYTRGIEQHPEYAPFYRHRGHRYISTRQFDAAIADLEKATELISGQPDEVEADGMPNSQNIPLTTLGYNVWYHLGVAEYLTGNFADAQAAFLQALTLAGEHDDNVVAVCDWLYTGYRRQNLDDRAQAVLMIIRPEMDVIENFAYHRRLLLYKGLVPPDELVNLPDAKPADHATLGYGLGNWYRAEGHADKAKAAFEAVVAGTCWPAFGFIASEVELAGKP